MYLVLPFLICLFLAAVAIADDRHHGDSRSYREAGRDNHPDIRSFTEDLGHSRREEVPSRDRSQDKESYSHRFRSHNPSSWNEVDRGFRDERSGEEGRRSR